MKTVLLISPDTFGYYKIIAEAIESKGYTVHWKNQLFFESSASRYVTRKWEFITKIFRRKILQHLTENIVHADIVIIIKGEGLGSLLIADLRGRYPESEIVYYTWDGVANSPGLLDKLAACDRGYSFDVSDSQRIAELRHLPLFFSKSDDTTKHVATHGAFFAGTLHSNRYFLIENISRAVAEATGLESFTFYYYRSQPLFLILRIFRKNFRRVPYSAVKFWPLTYESIYDLMAQSMVVIDIAHPDQTGLTMRTIESLGMCKKIITNNSSIKHYEFYDPKRVLLLEDGIVDPDRVSEFLNNGNPTMSEHISRLAIDHWVEVLLHG